jgi:hypothetical protein
MGASMFQQKSIPLGWVPTTPYIPTRDDFDFDLFISNITTIGPSGPPGPPGPPGPQGPAGSLENVAVTLIDAATYTAIDTEYFLGIIYNGISTITLPAVTSGKVYVVKDSLGDSNTNPISILATGTTIDGLASYTINTDWGSVTLLYNGIEWNIV